MKNFILSFALCVSLSAQSLTLEQRVAVLEVENNLLRHEVNHIHNEDIPAINKWIEYLYVCFKQIWGEVPQVMPGRDKSGDRF